MLNFSEKSFEFTFSKNFFKQLPLGKAFLAHKVKSFVKYKNRVGKSFVITFPNEKKYMGNNKNFA